jgi:hypothetical protein
MSESPTVPATSADDGFTRHYAEKLWALVPEVHRDEDARAAVPGQLRALVEILAGQAAVARRSVERLWGDTRVDEADDWAIPYIGALLGARPVNALNRDGQRANLARTILYRRRQGTARLAELLADDIADWDAVAQEGFVRLFRLWHQLDGGPEPGPITASPRWGYPDLRNPRVGGILDGFHDDLAHRPDVRRHRGVLGRYGIAKQNLHLFRVYAFALHGVTPYRSSDVSFTLDPSGRDVPLFQVGGREIADCSEAREWEMRAPLTCRRLAAAAFVPERAHVPALLADALEPVYGRRFVTEAELLEASNTALAADPVTPPSLSDVEARDLIAEAMVADCPRRNLLPGGDPAMASVALAVAGSPTAAPLGPERLYAANLDAWGADHAVAGWVEACVDPVRGRVRLMAPLTDDRSLHVQRVFQGAFWPVGARTYDRSSRVEAGAFTAIADAAPDWTAPLAGELRVMDSRTVRPMLPDDGVLEVTSDLTLRAAHGERPYVVLAPSDANEVILRATTPDLNLSIDGLWLAVEGAAAGPVALVLDGAWRRVELRDVTLDPGGERAEAPGGSPEPIPAVSLALAGTVADLVIDRSVLGPVVERLSGVSPCSTDVVVVRDSIVQSLSVDPAIDLVNARLQVDASTVLGDLRVGRLDASHLLVDGIAGVEDRQNGCFRFSAAGAGSQVARAYESHLFAPALPPATFVSTRFGDPGFAQLATTAPPQLAAGGEQGTEIGAYRRALDGIKRADLQAKLDEFMPINVITQQVLET